MLDPLVKRDLALIAAGKTPVGNPDEAMARAILVMNEALEKLGIDRELERHDSFAPPPPPDEGAGVLAEKEDQ